MGRLGGLQLSAAVLAQSVFNVTGQRQVWLVSMLHGVPVPVLQCENIPTQPLLAADWLLSLHCTAQGMSAMMGFTGTVDTLCGQAWGAKNYRAFGLVVQVGPRGIHRTTLRRGDALGVCNAMLRPPVACRYPLTAKHCRSASWPHLIQPCCPSLPRSMQRALLVNTAFSLIIMALWLKSETLFLALGQVGSGKGCWRGARKPSGSGRPAGARTEMGGCHALSCAAQSIAGLRMHPSTISGVPVPPPALPWQEPELSAVAARYMRLLSPSLPW